MTLTEQRILNSQSWMHMIAGPDIHWFFLIFRTWYSLIFSDIQDLIFIDKRLNRNHLSGILTAMINSCVRRLKIRDLNDPDYHGSSFRTDIVELAWIDLKPTHNQDKNTPWKLHWENPWFFLRVYIRFNTLLSNQYRYLNLG